MGLAAAGMMIAGTVMQAKAQKDQAEQEAKWMKYDAAVSEAQAKSERRAGAQKSALERERGQQMLAQKRALYPKAGVGFQGSPMVSMMNDAINIETDSRLTALEARERGRLLDAEAGLLRAKASATKKAGRAAMMSTLLGGLASAGMSYANYKSNKSGGSKSNYSGGSLAAEGRSRGLSAATARTITGRTPSGGYRFG